MNRPCEHKNWYRHDLFRRVFLWMLILFAGAGVWSPHAAAQEALAPVRLGADILLGDSLHLVKGRRIGLLCNHTSRLANNVYLFDTLRRVPSVQIVAVFAPEHGFSGTADAGALVESGTLDGIPLYSLYGRTRRPDHTMLEGMDVLVMDLQDIGARYYTYVTTMMYCLEAADEAGIDVVVLDRPNPLGGEKVEGPVRADSLQSFVSYLPIPVRHGMTVGELARMAVASGWLRGKAAPRLTVVPMRGWTRSMDFNATGLSWERPSPNIISPDAALAYIGTCLLEASSVSEGRGTEDPFLLFGAPFIDPLRVAEALNALMLPGVRFTSARFIPSPRPGASKPRYAGEHCGGVRLRITDRQIYSPWRCGVEILRTLLILYDGKVTLTSYLSLLAGVDNLFVENPSLQDENWQDAEERFSLARIPFLLYR